MEKYGTVRQATDEHLIRRIHFVCRITQATNTHTHTICNTYCLSTTTMVVRMRLDVIRTLSVSLSSEDILWFVDRASRYNCVEKAQLDAQPILSIFRQPLHVSGVSRPIIRRYNRMDTTIGTYYSF